MKTTNLIRRTAIALGLIFSLLASGLRAQFTPGEGGALTFTPFVPEAGKFAGFLIGKSDREYDSWFQSTRPSIDMSFPAASTLGATSLTLQHLKADGVSWENFIYDGNELSTTGNNFWLRLYQPETLRLIANGGPKSGYTSNIAVATPSFVDTRFSSWGLDESMWISGIMVPWVGRGLQANFTVKNTPAETVVTGGLSFRWYRVNPVTYDMTPIPGADSLTYITTNDDLGYLMMINATGNGTSVGGYINYMSGTPVVAHNTAFVDNISTTGFKLNLYKTVSSFPAEELELFDKDYKPVSITAVNQGENTAIYNISAALAKENSPYYLTNTSTFWRIATVHEFPGHMMVQEGVSIEMPTSGLQANPTGIRVFPLPASDMLNFSANTAIFTAELTDLNGRSIIFAKVNNNSGNFNVSNLPTGIYVLKLMTGEGSINKLVNLLK